MTSIATIRDCPFCGRPIILGRLPIVATNTVEGQDSADARRAKRVPCSGASVKGYVGEWPIVADPPLREPVDPSWRRFTRRVLGTELPSVASLADAADLPARVCVRCEWPLPDGFDDRKAFLIAVLGTTGAGKSHYLASLLEQATRRQMLSGIGCHEFVLDESVNTEYTRRYYIPVFRDRVQLDHTLSDPEIVRKPLICRVTFDDAMPALLLFHDIAGEVLGDRIRRATEASFLTRADAIIFLVDPVFLDRPDGTTWRSEGIDDTAYANQADLLNGVLSRMAARDRAPLAVAITLTKSDLLESFLQLPPGHRPEFSREPDMRSRAGWDSSLERVDAETKEILKRSGAFDILAAANLLDPAQVSFHAVAPIGENPDSETGKLRTLRPMRCLDPLVTVLFRIPGLAHSA